MRAVTSSPFSTRPFSTKDGRAGVVREATARDAAPCIAIVREATKMRPRTIMTMTEELWGVREWRKRMLSHGDAGVTLVAEVEGKIAGLLGAVRGDRPVTRHVAELGITVAESFRANGVGRALMLAFEHWARSLGVDRLVLTVYDSNAPARSLYESLGYVNEGSERRAVRFPEGDVDTIRMAKLL